MNAYFKLQTKLIGRQLRAAGFNPAFGLFLLVVGFGVFSWLLFQKTEYAWLLYVLLSLLLTGSLSERKRTEFLKISFKGAEWMRIRMIENLIAALPFILFLCFRLQFIPALILLFFTPIMAIVTFKTRFHLAIPTPFSQRPFEFTVGFRMTFFLYFVLYALTFIAIRADNFNLGIFALLAVFALSMGYYTQPEDELFVWNFSLNPKRFLLLKLKTALLYSSLSALPIVLTLGTVYFSDLHWILLFLFAGYSFLICMIVAKYSVYPGEINFAEGILIASGIVFPLLLLIIIPYFFKKSTNSLSNLLQ